MKKIALILSVWSSLLLASDIDILQKSMMQMEEGLSMMQKGYLYNNIDLVEKGLQMVEDGDKLFKKDDMKKYLPDNKKHMANIANNSSIRIEDAVQKMRKYLETKEYIKAHMSCAEIINGCTTCHSLVRNW